MSQIPIVTIDYESFFDPDYSLSKITTEEYIRSPLFETIGLSIWMPDAPVPIWYPGETGIKTLQSIDWSTHAMLAQNTAFDGAISAWRYNVHPKLYLDTMGMAQPHFGFTSGVGLGVLAKTLQLGEKGDDTRWAMGKRLKNFSPTELATYGAYCVNDTILCRRIFEKLLPLTPAKELATIDAALRCFIDPRIELDKAMLEEYYDQIVAIKQSHYVWAGNLLGITPEEVQTAIMSNDKLSILLQELDVDIPTKLSPATGKSMPAFAKTDEAFLALKDHEDPRVQVLVECRLGGKSTLAETRALRLIETASRGTLPVYLKYYAAHPGRFGGGDAINMQNLPRHKYKEGKLVERSKLRDALCAPHGHEFVVGDLSQIEARGVACVAGQDDVTEAFIAFDEGRGPDIYCVTATSVLGQTVTKADVKMRQLGKVIRLSLPYGVGWEKLMLTAQREGVNINQTQAQAIHSRFRELSPAIRKFWKDCDAALEALVKGEEFAFGVNGCIVVKADGIHLPSGRVLRYSGLERVKTEEWGWQYTYKNRKKVVRLWGSKVTENITQSLAGSVCMDAWLRLRNKMKIVMQVHDELVAVVHREGVETAMTQMREALNAPVKWLPGLPVACEVGHAWRYGMIQKA